MSGDLEVITKTYDFILWAIPKINKFPRSHRFVLGDRMCGALYNILANLIHARYHRLERLQTLTRVNTELETLRMMFRLSKDFTILDLRGYGLASEGVDEIGRLVGGWIKASVEK